MRRLEEVLRIASDLLFPGDLGERPIDVNTADDLGDTPLHCFAWRCDTEAIRVLINAGANVNAVGEMGETPLHIAVGKSSLEIVSLLLAAGAKTNIVSEFNQTPKERARQMGGAVAALFARGAQQAVQGDGPASGGSAP